MQSEVAFLSVAKHRGCDAEARVATIAADLACDRRKAPCSLFLWLSAFSLPQPLSRPLFRN